MSEAKRGVRDMQIFKGWLGRKKHMPSVPEDTRVYVVGDVHGCLDLLNRLLDKISQNAASAPSNRVLVFVGDYVDRGPNSSGVVECLLSLRDGFKSHFLLGNHDQALLDFLKDPLFYRVWKTYGAQETLLSYGVKPPRFDDAQTLDQIQLEFAAAFPPEHRKFFERLESSFEIGDYFITHAGVRPGVPLAAQSKEDQLWIRDAFLSSGANFGKVVVHGHTPSATPVRRHNRIGIDTGAYATGRLTALVLEGTRCGFLES